MTKLANAVETVVIALEDETALANLQSCLENVSPPAPKYYIVHAIPPASSAKYAKGRSDLSESDGDRGELLLAKCKRWLKSKYPCSRIVTCLVDGLFIEEVVPLLQRCEAEVLIVSHSTANSGESKSINIETCSPSSILVIEQG